MAVEFGSSLQCVQLIIQHLMADKSMMPLYKMKDDKGNNPLHSFVLGTTNKMVSNTLSLWQYNVLPTYVWCPLLKSTDNILWSQHEGDVAHREHILSALFNMNVHLKNSKLSDVKSTQKHEANRRLLESSRNQQGKNKDWPQLTIHWTIL